MKSLIVSLNVGGALCLLSAVSGISSFVTSNSGYTVTYHQSYLSRGYVTLFGCALLYLAWLVSRRHIMAWRLMFFAQGAAWASFVVGGSLTVGREYPQASSRDTLLFALLLTVVSLPVALYWGFRWRKQKPHFDIEPKNG
ncbi:hypothetical protein [Opitutus sp. GAS368]|uniref:hypothetical protein n=1 Tax=Opitutus sp. GAS368 TaxID=1882749 RepID=UPI00087DE40D|nr:hypothetical protein [Opitutus sp. GAS368]SDS52246.1 hypothetical protein SAMN05444173_3146 [Opitutus sp. GAS368]